MRKVKLSYFCQNKFELTHKNNIFSKNKKFLANFINLKLSLEFKFYIVLFEFEN